MNTVFHLFVSALLAVCLSSAAAAGSGNEPAAWRQDAKRDIDAIDRWVRGVYPAAVDPGNPGFLPEWSESVEQARRRAEDINTRAGWHFTIKALVNSARDGHVAFRPDEPRAPLSWAGLGLEKRGDRYLARHVQSGLESETRVADESEFLGCDGEDADTTLEQHLDLFVANWRIPAERTLAASQIFVDSGNPFVKRPHRCRFRSPGGEPLEIQLEWREVAHETLHAALRPFSRITSQRRKVDLAFAEDGSAWITLGNLGDYSALNALREEVGKQRDAVLAAPYLVWDLRGNGGGDSSLADAIARTLWGEKRFVPPAVPASPKRWRASALSIETIHEIRDRVAASDNPNPGLIAAADTLIPVLQAAVEAGEPLAPDPFMNATPKSAKTRLPVHHDNPVYFITDAGCFSSCINASYMLKRMGARQAGEPTRQNSIYGESWFFGKLPSKRGRVNLPIAIQAADASGLGGDMPDLPWTGAAGDHAGLRAMIADDARRTTR